MFNSKEPYAEVVVKQTVNFLNSTLGSAHNFIPDWTEVCEPNQFESEISGFKFNGPGWYLTKTDTVLVVPSNDHNYLFCVWNSGDTGHAFNQIVNAPVRLDAR